MALTARRITSVNGATKIIKKPQPAITAHHNKTTAGMALPLLNNGQVNGIIEII
jgi:hypothetical protein